MRRNFLDFFDAEYALVVRFMMRMGAGLADAEDAMQHVAEQGWRKVKRGQWGQVPFPRAWARTVALNHHRAQRRKHNEVPLDPNTDEPQPGPGHAELIGQSRDLVALLQHLDADCRTVIACDLDDIPASETATMLGRTPQQVRDLRKKARRQLAQYLTAATHGEGGNRQ